MMYKIFVVFVIGAVGFLFWRMGPGNDVTYYENRETTRAESYHDNKDDTKEYGLTVKLSTIQKNLAVSPVKLHIPNYYKNDGTGNDGLELYFANDTKPIILKIQNEPNGTAWANGNYRLEFWKGMYTLKISGKELYAGFWNEKF